MPAPISQEQSGRTGALIVSRLTVGTSALQLPFFRCKYLLVKSDNSNTGNIFAGSSSGVSASNGFQITPNGALGFGIDSSSRIWVIADTAGQIIEIAASNHPLSLAYSASSSVSGTVTANIEAGQYKYGTATSVAVTVTATLVSYTAVAGDRLAGFTGTGTRSGYFFVQVNGTTVMSGRAWTTNQNAVITPTIVKTLAVGDAVVLKVTNESPTNDTGNFEGTLYIAQ